MKNTIRHILHKLSILEGYKIKVLYFSIRHNDTGNAAISLSYRKLPTENIVEINFATPTNLDSILEDEYNDIFVEKSLFYQIPFKKRFEIIVRNTCEYYNVEPEDILIKGRKREIVKYRQLIQHFCKLFKGVEGLSTIGYATGNMDHATVIYAYNTVNNLRDTYNYFRIEYEQIKEAILNEFTNLQID